MSVSGSTFSPNPQYQEEVIPRAQLLSIFVGSGCQVAGLDRPEFPIVYRTLPLEVECQGQYSTDLSIILAVVESSIPNRFYGLLCRQRTANPWDWHMLQCVGSDDPSAAIDMIEQAFYDGYGIEFPTAHLESEEVY